MTLQVNGAPVDAKQENGYIVVHRQWQDGDVLHADMPMHLTAMTTPDGKPQYSFLYGPIVLAAKTGTDRQDGMYADDSRGGHIAGGPQIPLTQMPAIIGDAKSILHHLQPVADRPLTFSLTGLSLPQWEGMQLVPFYQLYECRYQIYFPLYSAAEWTTRQQEMALAEQARMALEAQTVDKVFCGEQQSESDHFFASEQSWNGSDGGTHWRRTRGSFSYQLRASEAKTIQLQCFADRHQRLQIMVNGTPLGTFSPDGQGYIKAALPTLPGDTFQLGIAAVDGQETPRVSEVRILKQSWRKVHE